MKLFFPVPVKKENENDMRCGRLKIQSMINSKLMLFMKNMHGIIDKNHIESQRVIIDYKNRYKLLKIP
jgi:hypothetical protein